MERSALGVGVVGALVAELRAPDVWASWPCSPALFPLRLCVLVSVCVRSRVPPLFLVPPGSFALWAVFIYILLAAPRKSVTFRETVDETVAKRHNAGGMGKNGGHHVS